jgi:hypothetical protein
MKNVEMTVSGSILPPSQAMIEYSSESTALSLCQYRARFMAIDGHLPVRAFSFE